MMMVYLLARRMPLHLKFVTLTTNTSTRLDPRSRPMINLKEASKSTRKSTRTVMLVHRSQNQKSPSAREETK